MPRPNRLEVTPLHAQANWSQTKARGSTGEPRSRRIGGRIVRVRESHGNNTQPRRHLSEHVCEDLDRGRVP